MSDKEQMEINGFPQMDPHVCKFVVAYPLYPDKSFNCLSKEQAQGSPLLEALFAIEGVDQVLIAGDSVTIAKATIEPWPVFGKKIGPVIREVIALGGELMSPELSPELDKVSENKVSGEAAEIIQNLLDTQINPAVAMHGGHVEFVDIKDDTVYVELSGGCQGCGMASVTLKQGIEVAIKEAIPSVKQILDVTDHASGQNPYYRPSTK